MATRKSRRIPRRLSFQSLERRQLLAGDIGHNFVQPQDVNLDGYVSASDALSIINQLNQQGLQNASGETTASSSTTTVLSDVDGNGVVTAGDALLVINQLNLRNQDEAPLQTAIDELAAAIANDSLPAKMSVETAHHWLGNLQSRMQPAGSTAPTTPTNTTDPLPPPPPPRP